MAEDQEGSRSSISQLRDFVRENYKEYILLLVIYLAIALVVFWPATLNITSTVPAGRVGVSTAGTGDIYQNLWNMWWVYYVIFQVHAPLYFTHLLFYPVGASLVTQTLSPLADIFSLVFQVVNLGFAYNVVLFTDFALSGLFMFLLADYLIGNKYGAFIAGIIFEFSPFHMSHALVGQLNWSSIEFMPLFILFFLLMIRGKKLFSVLGLSISFILVVFFGDPEQGIIALLFAAILLLVYLLNHEHRRDIISKKFVVSVISAVIIILIIGSPFFIPILSGVLHGAISEANAGSTLATHMVWSSPLLSFILPSPFNNIFSGLPSSYQQIYISDSGNRVAYLGWIALSLVFVAIYKYTQKRRFWPILTWIIIGVIFTWLALGPYLQIGALPQQINPNTSIPGIYLLYMVIPILNIVREPGRFNLIVTLCMAILAGFGFVEIAEHFRYKTSRNKLYTPKYLAVLVSILILIDYVGIPITSSYINSYFLKLYIPSGYSQIAKASGNFSVMVLPILPYAAIAPELYTGISMYYQTAFQKPMVGGYTSRENASQQYPRLNIPLSVIAASLQAGGPFTYGSPFNENATNVTLYFLARYHVRYVSVINQAYSNVSKLFMLDNYLTSTFGRSIYSDSATSIWLVNSTVQRAENKTITAYISSGNWTEGCTGSVTAVPCNNTLDVLWYGPGVRAINVSVPRNMTHITMSFYAASMNNNVTLYLFQTSDKHELGSALLKHSPVLYQLNLTLNQGLNSLFFVAPNTTEPNVDPYFNFGIRNITFKAR